MFRRCQKRHIKGGKSENKWSKRYILLNDGFIPGPVQQTRMVSTKTL